MLETTTMGVFTDRAHAEAAIVDLRVAGVADTNISYIYTSPEGKTITNDTTDSHVANGAASGVTTGALLGAIAGLVVANGILPGIGTLFVAGPLAAALGLTGAVATTAAGAMTGAAAGGLVGALGGLGVSASEAEVYEEKIKRGGILLTARSADPSKAKDIFKAHGADEIREYRLS
jgi:hypothetical protein